MFPKEELVTATHTPHRDAMATVVTCSTTFGAMKGDEFLRDFIVTASAGKLWFHEDSGDDFEIATLNIGFNFFLWEWGMFSLPNAACEEISNSRFDEKAFVGCVASLG